jgi:hypothetical protein
MTSPFENEVGGEIRERLGKREAFPKRPTTDEALAVRKNLLQNGPENCVWGPLAWVGKLFEKQ